MTYSNRDSRNHTAYIAIGSNIGDRMGCIDSATEKIAEISGVSNLIRSSVIETQPLGGVASRKYLNCVVKIETSLEPKELLDTLLQIESALGRLRPGPADNSRRIDLDIALFGQQILNSPTLILPHKYMHLRSFVLEGICQLNDKAVHPAFKKTVDVLADRLRGNNFVPDRYDPKLISIAGVVGVGKTTLARTLSKVIKADLVEENYQDNPYLAKVYAGDKSCALNSELYFVNSSANQLGKSALKPGRVYISDYVFQKAFVYANRWLDRSDFDVYKIEYEKLTEKVHPASVIIYLKGDLEKCLDRIKLRNRPFEDKIDIEFLSALEKNYDRVFNDFSASPIITIDADEFDMFNDNNCDVKNLASEIICYF